MAISKYLDNNSIDIAKGIVTGVSHIHKFGAVPAMSQSQTGTIWDKNDTVYPWSAFSTASVLTAQAVNASDNGKKLTLVGLDGDWAPLTEEITLSSSGTSATTNTFKRVFRGFISQGADNVGDIDVRIGATTVLQINAGNGQTLMCIYTVPAGYTGYLTKGACTAQSSADGNVRMFVRYGGQTAYRVGHTFEVSGAGGLYEYQFTIPQQIPEKSDIDIRVTTRSNNGRYTAAFDIILLQNNIA
jgi:hypothetical protein